MSPAPSPPSLGERFERAVAAALAVHRGRRGTPAGVPYVAHLFGVCTIVLENGGSESEAIAALLQRTVEENGRSEQLAAIRTAYGDDVGDIVAGCSDTADEPPGEPRRRFYDRTLALIERLLRLPTGGGPGGTASGVFLVSAADTLYDARATSDELSRGTDVFALTAGKKFGALWAYRALADAYRQREGRHAPFADALVELVDAMAGKPVTAAALLAAFAVDATVERREKGSLLAEGAP